MAEFRVRGLDDSACDSEVTAAIVKLTACDLNDIRVGTFRHSNDGLCTTVVRCPATVANKVVAEKKIRVGWTLARVEMLRERPLQCFKCLQGGHVRNRCPVSEDRSNCCFRCGASDHLVANCTAVVPSCPICKKAGCSSGHKTGGPTCKARPRMRRRGEASAPPPPPSSLPTVPLPVPVVIVEQMMEVESESLPQRKPRTHSDTAKQAASGDSREEADTARPSP
ncbi:uncharacterized protein [Cardiocondyla obscurior]|uniref:uncharacterized protein n=1 Tax=Cardiocondyla obscurior TaxID=286306 RepID=UPI0039658B60